ncbi:MAG: flavohemoglobin expression-modulating QEGLA motif protein [Gammaproteobacteria bacterium]|nr:flavohemoglobin expression-modulating QEGLA motif protein [Gammaproteobacteria bacterium]
MQNLKVSEIIELITQEKTFEAIASDNSFRIKINKYVPYCCTAIHDGSNLRDQLKGKIAINDYERWYEEDPHTGKFIDSLPITIVGLDSRFEYDLNRDPESCIYDEAWGKKVWKRSLTTSQKQISKKKHHNFYKVIHALVQKIETLYGSCVVYDLHSYNYQRWDRPVPLFNIGTERIDNSRYKKFIEHWETELSQISLSGVQNHTAINDVFYGRGYNLEFITQNFPNTLVLATEVKKVYSNELTGEDYPKIIRELQQKLKQAILNNAQYFSEENTNWKSKNNVHLLDKKTDRAIVSVDKQLFKLVKNFELLAHVNPINTNPEQKRFFKSKYTQAPKFKYAPIKINPFELKQQLNLLRIQDISDVSIRQMYESVINSYFDKIDLLSTLGTKKFLYNSLRYFGRPSKKDLTNAQYILHLPDIPSEPKKVPLLSVDKAIGSFKQALDDYGIQCKIELSNRVISQVMVLNSKKTILFRPDAKFTRKEINALVEHEIGVHMVTTQNSFDEKLKIFNLGLPVNTMTQEGLAILSEYLSGNITLKRLKKLALRVVITDMMCSGADFIECFNYLVNQHEVSKQDAYIIVTRIFRGGGFTKDYLYLAGFDKILKLWNANIDLSPLLVGKTSLHFYNTINEMIERDMIVKPKHITKSFVQPVGYQNDEIYEYIISGLK